MNNRKEFPILYKYTQTGKVQQWQIISEGNKFWTIEGIKDGKLTTSLPTICKGKNIGRANETTEEAQAIAEAASKHQKKKDKGYNEVLTADKAYFEPMLAKDFKESKDVNYEKHKVFVQPKLDGLRAVNSENTIFSRNGKPYVSCPHLYQDITILDGELYSHEYKDDFNKIVSLCKKQKPSEEELEESAAKVQMWVYDFPGHDGVFSKRYEALKKWYKEHNAARKGFVLVPTYEIKSDEELKEYHSMFLSEGYEGTIVRLDIAPYENKRSKQLLKYKDFVDEEFKIVDVIEGEGGRTGTAGKMIMQLEDGRTFGSNIKGDFVYLKYIIEKHRENPNFFVGKKATVKYFQLTPDGVPRFPFIIKIDRDEYE